MSNNDSFIDEVTEEVRRDRLFGMMRRYGWIAVALIVLLVGGAALNEWRKARAAAEAQALGDAILAALEAEPQSAARADELAAIGAEGPADAVVRLLTAAAAVEAEDRARAIAELKAVAADGALPRHYRDLALLKSVILDEDMAPADRIAALEPLTAIGAPYELLAREQIAIAEVQAGDRDAAIERLRGLLDDTNASQGLRRRVAQLIVALGGDPAAS